MPKTFPFLFFNREKLRQNVATEAEKSKIKHWPCVVLFSSCFSWCILTQSHDRMTTNTLVQNRCQTKWRQTPIYSILSVFLFRCRFPVFFKHRISLVRDSEKKYWAQKKNCIFSSKHVLKLSLVYFLCLSIDKTTVICFVSWRHSKRICK